MPPHGHPILHPPHGQPIPIPPPMQPGHPPFICPLSPPMLPPLAPSIGAGVFPDIFHRIFFLPGFPKPQCLVCPAREKFGNLATFFCLPMESHWSTYGITSPRDFCSTIHIITHAMLAKILRKKNTWEIHFNRSNKNLAESIILVTNPRGLHCNNISEYLGNFVGNGNIYTSHPEGLQL